MQFSTLAVAEKVVTPAKAGVHLFGLKTTWIPAFAGMTAVFALMICCVALTIPARAQTESKDIPTNTAMLRALDKVTARVQTLEVPVGEPVTFGRLEILARSCFTRPPEETPENAALLLITKTGSKGETTVAFDGWMFASSPGLSAMDDPVYDIWVLACENKTASKSD